MILDLCTKAIRHISDSTRRFIVVFAYTIVMYVSYLMYDNGIDYDLMSHIMIGCFIGVLAAVLLRLIEERRHPDHPRQIVVAVISLIPTIITTAILQFGSMAGRESITVCISTGIAIILMCAIMYILASEKHEKYIYAWAVRSMFFSWFVSLVMGIGISVCVAAVDSLLISLDYTVQEYIWVFICIVVYINLLCSYIPKADDELHISQFFKVIVAYVLLPIFLLLTAVLYLYILKIIFTLHMPSGTMNWYASLALAAWVGFWLTLRYIDNKLIQLYIRWGWILLIPIVIVQMIGVVIRLQAYGLTTARYISLTCTLLGVIAIIVAACAKRPRIMMIAVAICAGIITITPLNVYDVPNLDQYHRFVGLLSKYGKYDPQVGFVESDKTIIPDDDADKIRSGYEYLTYSYSERGYRNYDIDKDIFHDDLNMSVDELYTKLNMEDDTYGVHTFDYDDDHHNNYYRDTSLMNPSEYVDTTGTTKMYQVGIELNDGDYTYHQEFSDGTVLDLDLSNYIDELDEYLRYPVDGKDDPEYVPGDLSEHLCTIELDGGRIWVQYASVNSYEIIDNPPYYITGYYLKY